MPSRLLSLFPLEVVVFPRTQLPLHIFEDRYKEMVGEAIRDSSEFGIVLSKDNGIVNAGCTVIIDQILKKYPDGRMDIITSGRRRFEVLMLNEEKDFLRGEVEFFDDDDAGPAPPELQQKALRGYKELVQTGLARSSSQPNLTDPQLSFQLAQSIPDLDFLSMLLRTRSEAKRLQELVEFLMQYIPKQSYVLRMKQLAPLNGFGKTTGI